MERSADEVQSLWVNNRDTDFDIVLRDPTLFDVARRQLEVHGRLRVDENFACICGRQRLERWSTTRVECFEKRTDVMLNGGILRWIDFGAHSVDDDCDWYVLIVECRLRPCCR